MPGPAAFAFASAGIKVAAGIFGFGASKKAAKAAKAIGNFNADILNRKARETEDLAVFEIAQTAAQEASDLDFIDFQDNLLAVESIGKVKETGVRAEAVREEGTRFVSNQKAEAAAQGRTTAGGSSLEVMADSVAFFEMEALEETRQGRITQQGIGRSRDLLSRDRFATVERSRVTRGLLKRAGAINARNFRDQSTIARMGGQIQSAAFKTEGVTTLLSGGISAASTLNRAGVF